MAIALVANTAAQSTDTNSITTGSIDTTGATLLLMAIARLGSSAASPSDNKSNTWVLIRTETHSSGAGVDLYYVKNPSSVGAGHTFSSGGTALFPSVFVAAFSGTDTSQNVDQQNGNSAAGFVSTIQAGSVTPSVDNELLIAALMFSAVANTTTIDQSFNITNQFPVVAGLAYGGGLAYLLQGTAAARNPTWTFDLNDNPAASIATFRPAATGTISFMLTGIGR